VICGIPNMSSDVQGSSDQVILVTGGYDHTIKMWQAHTGVCQRTAQHTDSVSLTLTANA
jgi:G protein beta subunit-like protein